MDEIRDFLRSRSVANLTIVIINVAVFLILSCFGDTENADFMAAHGASYTPYIVQEICPEKTAMRNVSAWRFMENIIF